MNIENNLQSVKCKPKHEYYLQAMINLAKNKGEQLQNGNMEIIKQLILYSVKYVITHKYNNKDYKTRQEVEALQGFIQYTYTAMALLTPKQLINLFPITKDYDGEKYMMKDYYSTLKALKSYNMDSPIGTRIDDLLWDYQNDTVRKFLCKMLCVASDLQRLEGKMSLAEQWAADNNIETITIHEKEGYVLNNITHKAMSYKKPIPDYIKIAK